MHLSTTMARQWLLLLALLGLQLLPAQASAKLCADKLRVAIDVGHSKALPGARSATGKWEYDFNRRFAEELVTSSESWPDMELFMLTSEKLSLLGRPDQAARKGADFFLSIHHDSVQRKYIRLWWHEGRWREFSDTFKGYSLFVWEDSTHGNESIAAAKLIGRNLRQAGFSPTLHHAEPIAGENRRLLDRELGVYVAPFAVVRHARIPAVLFEVGVIVNREEERELEDPRVRAKIQLPLLHALRAFCIERATRHKQAAPRY